MKNKSHICTVRELRALLDRASFSQEFAAQQMGLTFGTVNNILNRRTRPAPKTIRKIEEFLIKFRSSARRA